MRIRIISIGKVKQSFVLDGESEYSKRLSRWIDLDIEEINPPDGLTGQQLKDKELGLVTSRIRKDEIVFALDENGKELTSQEFSSTLGRYMLSGRSQFTFLIGGAAGWSPEIKKVSTEIISLSKLTFTYQMTRLILTEQLYRALCIIKGVPYHKQ